MPNFALQPQNLEQIANLPATYFGEGQQLLGQLQNSNDLTGQDQQRQFNYDTANDPLKLREKDLANQTTAAELPWHQAKAAILGRQNSNEALTNDAKIKDILGQYSSAEIGRHATDAENMGSRLSQMGEEAFSNPIGAKQRVKQELTSMGMGHLYNPAWDTDPEDSPITGAGLFARRLKDTGEALQTTSSKYRQAMALADAKANAALGVANINREGKVDVATITSAQRAEAAKALMSTKKEIANIPKSLVDYAAKMSKLANDEEDPIAKATYQHEADIATARATQLASASATVTTDVKPNLNALGIETVGKGKGGTPTPVMSGAQGKAPEGWPDGAVSNPDGTITYNGKTYQKKK